ncbi:unnamed protein product [Leptidea sinapis]|uniref:Uncharacterized protein n=1 Tax=Leptidea sinapis TaxID=189913 RepID=A0A5E4Q9A7_9NEOP|nr:unnamed protein product [Leptidea sinapis]
MNSSKEVAKDQNKTNTGYSWSYLFNSRKRTTSENSVSSNCSNSSTESGTLGGLQRQTSKNNDEYLWMITRRSE